MPLISTYTKVLSHFVPFLASCRTRLEHFVNSCVLCSPVAQMVQLVSNSSLSLVLINRREISVISKRRYFTVNWRTGIMIDLGVAVFIQTMWFVLLSLRVALGIRYFCLFWCIFSHLSWLLCCCLISIVQQSMTQLGYSSSSSATTSSSSRTFSALRNLPLISIWHWSCASTKLKETVSFLSDAFALFLHLPKKKGASGSRDGQYPGLITTNAYLQNKFNEEGAAGSSSSEAVAMLSGFSKSRSCGSEGFAKA